jgi:TRAP-type C4-dicarboxylate transport system substrate-binding protein
MKKILYCFIVITFVVGFSVGDCRAQKKVILKMITAWPTTQFIAKDMVENNLPMINQHCTGEIEIKYVGGPEVFTAFEALDALSRGAVDIIGNAFSYQEGKLPELGLIGIPVGWTLDNYLDVLHGSGIRTRINELFEKRFNAKLIGIHDMLGFVLATGKKPVTKLEDLPGLKIRGAGGMTTQFIGSLGASAVTISAEEVSMAAERRVIDGVITPPAGITSYKWYPTLKYMLMPPIAWGASVYFMNLDNWNRLSSRQQTCLKEAFHEVDLNGQQWIKKVQTSSVEELKRMGMEVSYLSPEELLRWQAKYEPALKQTYFTNAGENGKELWNMLMKYLEKK